MPRWSQGALVGSAATRRAWTRMRPRAVGTFNTRPLAWAEHACGQMQMCSAVHLVAMLTCTCARAKKHAPWRATRGCWSIDHGRISLCIATYTHAHTHTTQANVITIIWNRREAPGGFFLVHARGALGGSEGGGSGRWAGANGLLPWPPACACHGRPRSGPARAGRATQVQEGARERQLERAKRERERGTRSSKWGGELPT